MSTLLFGMIATAALLLLLSYYLHFKKNHANLPQTQQPLLFIAPSAMAARPVRDSEPAKQRDYGIQSLAREIATTEKSPQDRKKSDVTPAVDDRLATEPEPKIHPLLSDSREFTPDAVLVAASSPQAPIKNDLPMDPIAQALQTFAPSASKVMPLPRVDVPKPPIPSDPTVQEAPLFLNSNGIIINYDAIWHATNNLPPAVPARVSDVVGLGPSAQDVPAEPGTEGPFDVAQSSESCTAEVLHESISAIEPPESSKESFAESGVTEFEVLGNAAIENLPYSEIARFPGSLELSVAPGSSEIFQTHETLPAVTEPAEGTSDGSNYLAFYGLGQQPFDVTPDPGYLYLSAVHREALAALSQGVENFRGFMGLVAEPGLGKTTVLHKIMEEFRDKARIVFLFQTQCSPSELLRYLLSELGVDYDGTDVVGMHKKLNEVLFQEMLQGRRFILIVDEAQNLDDSVLETIRLLSNFETTHSKLIQIILAGQPELLDTLVRPCLSQLRQRIAILTHLEPLSAGETAKYISHRLHTAGFDGIPMFTPEALELIAERSGGVPRCINNICFNALVAGYGLRKHVIDSEIIRKAAADLDLALLLKRTQRDLPESLPAYSSEIVNEHNISANPYRANANLENGSSKLARLLIEALAGNDKHAGTDAAADPRKGFALTGKLTEKLTSQSWGKKNEFRIQVSLEREYSPSLPVADHYYRRSFYVSEDQAIHLREGKQVRIKFEQD